VNTRNDAELLWDVSTPYYYWARISIWPAVHGENKANLRKILNGTRVPADAHTWAIPLTEELTNSSTSQPPRGSSGVRERRTPTPGTGPFLADRLRAVSLGEGCSDERLRAIWGALFVVSFISPACGSQPGTGGSFPTSALIALAKIARWNRQNKPANTSSSGHQTL
jgi:hypothetical protein